jgi:hypothetical protein
MTRPLLPPKGNFVPTSMIYTTRLLPPLLHTWLQLRGLAWGRDVTPPIHLQEISALTGKSLSTIYGHMSLLRQMSALSWRSTGQGMLIVSFIDHPSGEIDDSSVPNPDSTIPKSKIPDSRNLESPSHSLTTSQESESMLISENDPLILESSHISSNQLQGEEESEGERGSDEALPSSTRSCPGKGGSPPASALHSRSSQDSDAESLHAGPVALYRHLVHLTPNPAQRRILVSQVSDLSVWQTSLEHWLGHGWNPRNLTGMLELYQRGGPAGCRYCLKHPPATRPSETPLQHSLAALDALSHNQDPSPGSSS